MKLAHLVVIRVFVNENEDYAKTIEKLKSLLPFDLEGQKKIHTAVLRESTVHGFNKRKIRIAELRIERTALINAFLKKLAAMLNEKQVETLLRDAENSVDERMDFCMRLDKKYLVERGECQLTDSGDCYHIRISIAAFPKKRMNAIETLRQIFKKEL